MNLLCYMVATVAQSVRPYTLYQSCDRPKLLKYVVTAALQIARQQPSVTAPRK